jgi:hypothetical protein
MSNNQYHSRELVNKTATHRKLWVAVFGSYLNNYSQFNIYLCLETTEVEGLNPITSVSDLFHTADLEDMCTLDTKASEYNECNIHQTPYLTKLIQIKEALRNECIEQSDLFSISCVDLSNQIIKPLLEKAI